MMSFKEFINRRVLCEGVSKLLIEYETYRLIPGTKNSYRQDSANTNTFTQKHAHVFAKPNGNGKQLYSVNFDGSGHDGSSGTQIPDIQARHFRDLGYSISSDNILESLSSGDINSNSYSLLILNDAPLSTAERLVFLVTENADE